jgi:16S rRNA A1518/A1519 N6-dimethyltransferase RsmA/KsgA/DIM1 with predicted DNA glycosylase/AP lyase activity
MVRADLVVQWQVARARVHAERGPPLDLLAATWAPWWTFRRGRRLSREQFQPRPSVDAAVLIACRRSPALLPVVEWEPFRDLVRPRVPRPERRAVRPRARRGSDGSPSLPGAAPVPGDPAERGDRRPVDRTVPGDLVGA